LFSGIKFRLAIFLFSCQKDKPQQIFTTGYLKWYAEERDYLFVSKLLYTSVFSKVNDAIPKIADILHSSVISKLAELKSHRCRLTFYKGEHKVYYHDAPINWIRAHTSIPFFTSERDGDKSSAHLKSIDFSTKKLADSAFSVICSNLFFIWYVTTSSCYNLNKREVDSFPIDLGNEELTKALESLQNRLEVDFIKNSKRRVYIYKTTGRVEYDEFYPHKSKPIIDKIDRILAQHYGFTDEELDFIINYDIKYRMGKDDGGGDD
jgi:hypothetical protein